VKASFLSVGLSGIAEKTTVGFNRRIAAVCLRIKGGHSAVPVPKP
jgi:hypothetical protein